MTRSATGSAIPESIANVLPKIVGIFHSSYENRSAATELIIIGFFTMDNSGFMPNDTFSVRLLKKESDVMDKIFWPIIKNDPITPVNIRPL